jgi:hypothetical protein
MKRVLFLPSSYHKGLKKEFQAACLQTTAKKGRSPDSMGVHYLFEKIKCLKKYLQAKITLIWIQEPDFCISGPGIFNLNPMSDDRL